MGNSDHENARQMNLAAGACLKKGDFGGALDNFAKALEFLPEGELEAKARLHSNMGHVRVNLQRYADALSSFRNAGKVFRQLGDKIGQGEQFANIGSVHRDMERWDASLDCYFRALEIFQEVGHRRGIADQYSNIGYAHSMRGTVRNALQFFEKAKEIYDALGEEKKAKLCDQNLQALASYMKERDSLNEGP